MRVVPTNVEGLDRGVSVVKSPFDPRIFRLGGNIYGQVDTGLQLLCQLPRGDDPDNFMFMRSRLGATYDVRPKLQGSDVRMTLIDFNGRATPGKTLHFSGVEKVYGGFLGLDASRRRVEVHTIHHLGRVVQLEDSLHTFNAFPNGDVTLNRTVLTQHGERQADSIFEHIATDSFEDAEMFQELPYSSSMSRGVIDLMVARRMPVKAYFHVSIFHKDHIYAQDFNGITKFAVTEDYDKLSLEPCGFVQGSFHNIFAIGDVVYLLGDDGISILEEE